MSRFAGAAEIFPTALVINPFDADETARALDRALAMPLRERRKRWEGLWEAVNTHSVSNWADGYLRALAALPARG